MVLTLLIITLIAAASVGVVYSVTQEPIAASKAAKTTNALAAVLPEFDNDPSAEVKDLVIDEIPVKIYTARRGSEIAGYAVETATKKGFGGEVKLMVGLRPDGEIVRIATLQHNETPGLGDKMDASKSDFPLQFEGKDPASFKISVKKDGGDVQAITAATISSRAFCDAVSRAYAAFGQVAGVEVEGVSGATVQHAGENETSKEGGENNG